MNKFILMVGKSCTGKDTLTTFIKSRFNVHEMKNTTTRPKRGEDDNGYYFLSHEEFTKEFFADEFIECKEYGEWFYGIKRKEVREDEVNYAVLSVERANLFYDYLQETKKLDNTLVIFLTAPEEVRVKRYINRLTETDTLNLKNLSELVRRFETENYDYRMTTIEDFKNIIYIDSSKEDAKDKIENIIEIFIKGEK